MIVFRNIQLILIKMRKCHSILCFLFSLPVYKCIQLQYQQGLDEFKERKKEIGIKEH